MQKMRIRIILLLKIAVADFKEFVIAVSDWDSQNHDCGFAVAD